MTKLGAALLILLVPMLALAAAPQHDSRAPIEIAADHFLADNEAHTGTWWGNVVVKQGDLLMHADRVRGHIQGNTADKIYADGHVVVDSPKSGTATGDKGVYDVAHRMITLEGRVVLKKQKDVMRGSTLAVNLATGQARLDAKSAPGGRVQAIFTPAGAGTARNAGK
jgi:lipopolysaccharide export system protein LptA